MQFESDVGKGRLAGCDVVKVKSDWCQKRSCISESGDLLMRKDGNINTLSGLKMIGIAVRQRGSILLRKSGGSYQ